MVTIHIPKPWESESDVTPQGVFLNRRRFLKSMIGASVAMAPIIGCGQTPQSPPLEGAIKKLNKVQRNPKFAKADRPMTDEAVAAKYNNFYEFGGTKDVWQASQALPTDNWKLEVTGEVKKPRTYYLDDLPRRFSIEERVYRFRCVEAWSMVVPWVGFPMKLLLKDVEPTSHAKYVRMISFYDPAITPGPAGIPAGALPWPYTEGLTVQEMAAEVAFFAIGIYGHSLPKQHGAPIRMVVPWKYGFKGAKSLVKIDFVRQQPATYWNTLQANEYDFEANVNPKKPHPRWSQATERVLGPGPSAFWERRPTLPYNGYGEYVAHLYKT